MSRLVELLMLHGATLLAGATLLLALGSVANLVLRAPIHRQRISELTVMGILIWLLLACVPLRRPAMELFRQQLGSDRFGRDFRDARIDASTEDRPVPQSAESLGGASVGELLALATALTEPAEEPPAAWSGASVEEMSWPTSGNVEELSSPVSGRRGTPATRCKQGAVTAYLIGTAVSLVWLQAGWLLLVRLVRSSAAPQPWLDELYRSLPFPGGRARPRLLVSTRCRQAFSCGIWRPTIVLPAEACRPGRTAQVRHVLLHELGHAAQRDAWGNFVLNLALPVLYVHPLYWWLRRQVRVARELIADDRAARQSSKEAYVEDLLALVKARGHFRLSYLGVLGMSTPHTHFYRRMEMLLQREQPLSTRCSGVWRWLLLPACAVVVVAMVATIGAQRTSAQQRGSDAKVEQAGDSEPDSDSEAQVGTGDTAQEKKLKATIAELQREREALRAQLEELRKRMTQFQTRMVDQRKAAQARKQAEEAREQEASATTVLRAQFEQAAKAASQAAEARARQAGAQAQQVAEDEARAKKSEAEAARRDAVYRLRAEDEAVNRNVRPSDEADYRSARPGSSDAREPAEDEEQRRIDYFQRAFDAQTRVGAALGRGRSGPQSDLDALINLATQYVTAQSELRATEARLGKMNEANDRAANTFPATEVDALAIQRETAERKLELFGAIAKALEDATQAEIQAVQGTMRERGLDRSEVLAARSQLAQAEAKLKILRLILK